MMHFARNGGDYNSPAMLIPSVIGCIILQRNNNMHVDCTCSFNAIFTVLSFNVLLVVNNESS